MKTIEEINVNGTTFKINTEVRLKGDKEIGIIKEIQYSGYFEESRKYDLMIHWLDDHITIRTPISYFIEVMEFV